MGRLLGRCNGANSDGERPLLRAEEAVRCQSWRDVDDFHYIPSHHNADALDVARIKFRGIFLLLAPVGGRKVAPGYKEMLLRDLWADFKGSGSLRVEVVFVRYGRLLSTVFGVAWQ